MKLILADATGVAGRELLPLPVERGHETDEPSWVAVLLPNFGTQNRGDRI